MFDRFGEFDSAAEINETAVNLRREGDIESLKVLATENGIDPDILEVFVSGDLIYLCDDMTAALGKLDVHECAAVAESNRKVCEGRMGNRMRKRRAETSKRCKYIHRLSEYEDCPRI